MLQTILESEYGTKLKEFYHTVDQFCGGIFGIVWDSLNSYINTRATEAAASLAYYALFSIFPLLVILVSSASSFLEDAVIQKYLFDFVEQSMPLYIQDLIKGNILQALAARGRLQIIGMIGLLWSASGVFTGLTFNIDRAWHHDAQERNFIFGRLVGLSMIGIITTGLVFVWFLSNVVLNILPWLEVSIWNGAGFHLYNSYTWSLLSRLIPWFVIFFTFWNLYRWVPNTSAKVKWSEAAWGAAIAGLGWELIQRGFSWYLASRFARYELIYGSLGALIAFMLWLYLSAFIVLYGAHLSAAIARHTRLNQDEAI
jgi:membrane protein